MRIIIVSTIIPFVVGGGELIVDWLDETLKKYGYKSEVIKIPFRSSPPEMLEQMVALRLLDLTDYADLLITIRTPSYIIRHPNKVVWFIHHHRGAYDLWGTPYQDIPNTPEGFKIRDSIIQADNVFLREAKKIFTNSRVMSDRLRRFNDINSEVLYPPLMNADRYSCKEWGDYFFYPSRITHHKRQFLVAESMRYTKSPVTLVLAGSADTKENAEHVKSVIHKYRLEHKIKFINRWISDEEKIELFANALGCVYIPYDEDSYGYVSLEAFHSGKPLITCHDSGGTLELVQNGLNGFVVPSDPHAIAEAMDRLFLNKDLSRKMGQAGRERLLSAGITWDNVVEKLVK